MTVKKKTFPQETVWVAEIVGLALGLGLFLFAWAFKGRSEMGGALLGSGLILLNAELWRQILQHLLHPASNFGKKDPRVRLAVLVVVLQVKLLVLCLVVFWLMRKFHWSPLYLLLGSLALPLALAVVWGTKKVLERSPPGGDPPDPQEGQTHG